jgi:integrase/recombinase XerD
LAVEAKKVSVTFNNPQGYEALWLTNDGEPLSYYGFGGIVRRIEAGAGVKFHAHQFRHTFGTLMAAQSISLKELSALMGHESVTTTEIYIQLSPDTLANAHRSRSPLAQLDAAKGLRRRPGRPKRIE